MLLIATFSGLAACGRRGKHYMLESERLHLKGKKEGRTEERHDMIKNALKRGTTPEQLIHLMGFEKKEILACQKELETTK